MFPLILSGCLDAGPPLGAVDDPKPGTQPGQATAGDQSAAVPDAAEVKAKFESNVQALLLSDCGTNCHAAAGASAPGFLVAAPDVFTTFTSFPGLIGATPAASRVLLKDPHLGPKSYHASTAYTPPPELAAHAKIIADWITLYAASKVSAGGAGDAGRKHHIVPFLPVFGTAKTVDLGEFDPALGGVSFSFTPLAVGATQIQIKDITIKATASVGAKLKTPVFATYAASAPDVAIQADADYLGAVFSAFPGNSTVLSPSFTIFPYVAGQLVGLSFDTVSPTTGAAVDMGATGACKNVPGFAAFKPMLTGGAGPQCQQCHDNGAGGFNTSGILNSAADAATCQGVLLNTTPASPATSPLYVALTGPKQHPGGKITGAAATTFLNALTTWLNTEK